MHKPLFLLRSSKTLWRKRKGESEAVAVLTRTCLSLLKWGFVWEQVSTVPSPPRSHLSVLPLYLSRSPDFCLSFTFHSWRRVWMWIEQQIRSVLIMPVKGGLGEHLSLAPSRNGRSPGSWSPPLLPSRHCHSYQRSETRAAPPLQDPWTPKIRDQPLVIRGHFDKYLLKFCIFKRYKFVVLLTVLSFSQS